ncbi:MAG: pantoate--beta-alanine ligase [Gammaproteobacteria bacterium]|nr:pantoate--beta-alanine ligase [Gammaproteobacteria bacterium]
MQIIKQENKIKEYCKILINKDKLISLVPTMGNLHAGHESLIKKARDNGGYVIVTIFINPLQFDNISDLNKYPKTIEEDLKILEKHNVDCLYLPNEEDILSDIDKTSKERMPEYMNRLCGQYRDNHFNGVYKIVKKLFSIIKPADVFFGKKDYQQLLLVKHINKNVFNDNINIHECDTIREENGLAISSRNIHLSNNEKNQASNVYNALSDFKKKIHKKNITNNGIFQEWEIFKKLFFYEMKTHNISIEYCELLCKTDLTIAYHDQTKLMIFVAFYIPSKERIRLIDNIEI